MKAKVCISILFLLLFVVGIYASEQIPVAVSPGNDAGIAVVGEVCPTFSWTAVEGSAAYRVEVFNAIGNTELAFEDIAAMSYPVLTKEILGAATSWTPSSDQRLVHDGIYVWYVQAIDAYGAGAWSKGEIFKVDVGLSFSPIEETVIKTLEEHGVDNNIIDEVIRNVNNNQKSSAASSTPPLPISVQGLEGGYNTFYGQLAGLLTVERPSDGNGVYNTYIGCASGYTDVNGYHNTYLGNQSGRNSYFGVMNTFLGSRAGYNSYGAGANVFVGFGAGNSSYNGWQNIYIGYEAGWFNVDGSGNIFLGHKAGYNETGSNKLYIDNSNTSSPLIYGEFDNDIVALMGTVGVGTKSPAFPMEMKKTGTNASIVVDRTDGATNYINATDTSGNFGTVTNHVLRLVVNSVWRMRLHTDNSLTFRNGASCTSGGVWTNASSRDLKEDINELTTEQAVDALNGLQPVSYKYKADKEDGHLGFIAEDVPDLVASKDRKGMSPMDVVAVLTKVLQEQQKVNEELRAEIEELKTLLRQDR